MVKVERNGRTRNGELRNDKERKTVVEKSYFVIEDRNIRRDEVERK